MPVLTRYRFRWNLQVSSRKHWVKSERWELRGYRAKPRNFIRIRPSLPVLVDECLQMTVYPGYGGQKFKSGPLANVRALRAAANAAGKSDFRIMVDGGIDRNSIAACAEAVANAFVAGTALYSKADMKAEINYFRALISGIQK